jgi:hypothetical protein
MAIGVTLDFHGATLEQYDQAIEKFGFKTGGPGAPGGLFHWVTPTDDGFRVIDVWESREHFDRFVQETAIPALGEAGVPQEPEVTFYEVHNYLAAG